MLAESSDNLTLIKNKHERRLIIMGCDMEDAGNFSCVIPDCDKTSANVTVESEYIVVLNTINNHTSSILETIEHPTVSMKYII